MATTWKRIIAQLAKRLQSKPYPKGQLLLAQDDLLSTAFIVKRGAVRVYAIAPDGEEKTITFQLKHDIFPLEWLFSRCEQSLYFYEAFTDCELYQLPKPVFERALAAKPALTADLMQYLLDDHIMSGLRFHALEQSLSRDKIIHTLHTLCLRYGTKIAENVVRLRLPLRQQDLANIIGLTRETVALELRKLKLSGVLAYKDSNYTIKIDKLSKLLSIRYNPGVALYAP